MSVFSIEHKSLLKNLGQEKQVLCALFLDLWKMLIFSNEQTVTSVKYEDF